MATEIVDARFVPLGHAQTATLSAVTAAALPSIPAGATHALIQVLTQNIRWRDDGTDPIVTVGIQIAAGKERLYATNDLFAAFKMISEVASAEINVAYYKAS